MGYIKHRFTDGTFFEIIDGSASYGVNGIALCCNGEFMDKIDLDGNEWYYRSDGSYSFYTVLNGVAEHITGVNTVTSPWGLRFSYFNPADNNSRVANGAFTYAQYVSNIPTSGYAIYTGQEPLIIPRPALPYYSGSVGNFGGRQFSQEEWESAFPLSTAVESIKYPITYSATNGTVTGPAEAAVGETVVATGTPNANYGITDYTTQIAVTCNDIPVPFTFNATTNEITFEMPDPTSG